MKIKCVVCILITKFIAFTTHALYAQDPSRYTVVYSPIPPMKQVIKEYKQKYPDIKIILNDEKGIWDREKSERISLEQDLTIGGSLEDEDPYIFHRSAGIVSDRFGNIYVSAFMSDIPIKKFDSQGRYLGTVGSVGVGPGEFTGMYQLIITKDDTLNVFCQGTNRIEKYDMNGKYTRSITLRGKSFEMGDLYFLINNEGDILISAYERESDGVIHLFSKTGEYLHSFGDPVDVHGDRPFSDLTISGIISKGLLLLVNDELWYSQRNPYEIRKYQNNRLTQVIFRRNDFMPAFSVRVPKTGGGNLVTSPAASVALGRWKDYIINAVHIPSGKQKLTVVDLFNLEGELLTSLSIDKKIYFASIDQQGRLYGRTGGYQEPEAVVRYKLVEK